MPLSHLARRSKSHRRRGPLAAPSRESLRTSASEAELLELGGIASLCAEARPEGARCFMTAGQRSRLQMMLMMRIQGAAGLFQDALSEARVLATLAKADSSILELAVDIFYSVARAATPAIAGALSTVTRQVVKPAPIGQMVIGVHTFEEVEERILSEGAQKGLEGVLRVGTRQARSAMRRQIAALGDEKRLRIAFLGSVKSRINQQVPEIWASAVSGLDDAELIVFTSWWSAENHPFEYYQAQLAELLAAHKAVERLGTRSRHVRTVVGPHDQKRLAHCELGVDTLGLLRDYSPEQRGTDGETTFPIFKGWVDDRLVGAARGRQLELAAAERAKSLPGLQTLPPASVAEIQWDAPWFFASGRPAKEHPAIQRWLKESTPSFVQEVYWAEGAS